jgi:hypothetical protein
MRCAFCEGSRVQGSKSMLHLGGDKAVRPTWTEVRGVGFTDGKQSTR